VPSIFTTFEQYNSKAQFGLRLLRPLLADDVRYSVFGAFAYNLNDTSSGEPPYVNTVAKLVYRHYGVVVHQALYQPEASNPQGPNQAPKLHGWSHKPGIDACVYIMEYLLPPSFDGPGWYTLAELNQDMVAKKLDLIYSVLTNIVNRLITLKLVHGDLRPNNIMIRMQDRTLIAKPVEIKVVDFEWADKVGVARYPQNRNEDIGYPGKAGGLIGWDDDLDMINKWRKGMLDYVARNRAHDQAMDVGALL